MSTSQKFRRFPLVYCFCALTCAVLLAQSWSKLVPACFYSQTTFSRILTLILLVRQNIDNLGCRALLETGGWTTSSVDSDGKLQQYHKWQPIGCRLNHYTIAEIGNCLGGRRIVFAGDSTIRQIFWAAAMELNFTQASERSKTAEKHSNQKFDGQGITLLYIWDPWINSTALQSELSLFSQDLKEMATSLQTGFNNRAALLLVGTPALWAAAFGGDVYEAIFEQGVHQIRDVISLDLEQSLINSNSYSADQIFLSPVLYPFYKALNAERAETLTHKKLEYTNKLLAMSSPELQSRILWAYNDLTYGLTNVHDVMGVHVVHSIARLQFQIALNARCNNAAPQTSPPKGTCCMVPHQISKIHYFFGIPLAVTLCARLLLLRAHKQSPAERACGQLLFTLAWSWFSDRSGAFTTIERSFHPSFLPILCVSWLMVCFLVGTSKTTCTTSKTTKCTSLDSAGYLSRKQTDEFKGLMQGLILIYHYAHGSKILPVYKLIRLFVAMYFFLSTHGHSTYLLQHFWRKTHEKTLTPLDYKYRHIAATLFRLNALSLLLPIAMTTTNYVSYYFAPCVSFWFILTFATLSIKPHWNFLPWALTAKVCIAALIAHYLIFTPGVLEGASQVSSWVFGMSWSTEEMRFRLALDRFVAPAGIVVAGWNFQQQKNCIRTSKGVPGNVEGGNNRLPRWLLIGSLCTIGLYVCIFIIPSPLGQGELFTKYSYNALHPYIMPFVVVAVLVLRNSTAKSRLSYLTLPAMLGRISLETYVLQYHIWLANDATSLLSIGLVDRYGGILSRQIAAQSLVTVAARSFEACLLTAVFIGVACLAHRATHVLGQLIFRNNKSDSRCSRS